MTLQFRSLLEVLVAWLVGVVLALLVFMWPTTGPCPHHQACAIEAMPRLQLALMFIALVLPGSIATVMWLRSRKSQREEALKQTHSKQFG